MTQAQPTTASQVVAQYEHLSNCLSLKPSNEENHHDQGTAVRARFITPLDPVIETATGDRLPAVPLEEAHRINALEEKINGQEQLRSGTAYQKEQFSRRRHKPPQGTEGDTLDIALPPLRTHPLFPPLPAYGPPSLLRNAQCLVFRITSFYLSTAFLLVIVLGALFTSLPGIARRIWLRFTFRDPDKQRLLHAEEQKRAAARKDEEHRWSSRPGHSKRTTSSTARSTAPSPAPREQYEPLEGGPDKLLCDARYYARRVGLEMEKFKVQTEDGFIIDLWHLYDPTERGPVSSTTKEEQGPHIFERLDRSHVTDAKGKKRYPVLLIHGLLQSAGAYCCNDDDSLAFYLHKAGYDVWLGNNRCGFTPQHSLLEYNDPRMWAWNIRQMGVMDLPAFISRVLSETGFSKLGLVAHSQGTTETFVALAKEQRPDLGEKISVFCALAPAVFAGPLIEKMYFKFMKVISPAMFRIFFGIHAFIPLMMTMHSILPAKLYGMMGYLVFSFLFDWSDERWDRGLRDRAFQFAPVYVSSESMRWWLGRECFAKHKCVLSTDSEDVEEHVNHKTATIDHGDEDEKSHDQVSRKGGSAWYDERCPPFALWIAGSDNLVDGQRLLRRFKQGREPHVRLVYSKVIDEYEHLDVLWAMDSIEKVGTEVKSVLWHTMSSADKEQCRPVQGVAEIAA